jgi:TonB family protein
VWRQRPVVLGVPVSFRSLSAALVAALLLHAVVPAAHARDERAPERLPRQPEPTPEEYEQQVVAQVRRSLFYPDEARGDRQTGEAVVRIALSAEGRVLSTVIAQSSGHAALDRAVISAVLRASPFPPTPPGIPNPMKIDVAVVFGLRPR